MPYIGFAPAFRFLREARTPNALRPLMKRGSAVGERDDVNQSESPSRTFSDAIRPSSECGTWARTREVWWCDTVPVLAQPSPPESRAGSPGSDARSSDAMSRGTFA
jgi:hypothetical protein